MRAQIEITEACNNSCVHCYNYWRYTETGQKLAYDDHSRSYEHFERILDLIIAQEVVSLTFTGGEPFLRRDVLFPLVKRAKQSGLQISINTNASLIMPQDAELAKDLEVDYFLISLLSYDEETHNAMAHAKSYKGTIRGIKLLLDSGVPLSVNMVTSQGNWRHVRQTASMLHDLGVGSFSATPILSCYLSKEHSNIMLKPEEVKTTLADLTWAQNTLNLKVGILEPIVYCMFNEKERQEYNHILGSRYCCAGISDCAISPDGDIRPCILSTDTGGNILKDDWDASWANLSKWKSPEMLPQECLKCSIVDSCGGGCRAAAKARHDTFTDKDPYMTSPIEKTTGEETEQCFREDLIISDTEIIVPNPKLRYRRENFGGCFYVDENYIFMNDEIFQLSLEILRMSVVSVENITDKYGLEKDDVRLFLKTLIRGGFLRKMKEVKIETFK